MHHSIPLGRCNIVQEPGGEVGVRADEC